MTTNQADMPLIFFAMSATGNESAAGVTNETWIHGWVRKVSLRQMMLAGVLLAGTLLGWTLFANYWRSFFHGAVDASFADLAASDGKGSGGREYLRVHGDKTYNTGLTQITKHTMNGVETSRETSAYYYILRVDDQPLLVKGKQITQTPEGRLVPIPPDIASDLFAGPRGGRLKTVMLPYMLEASVPFRENGWYAIAASLAAIALAVWMGLRGMRRIGDPRSHPTVQWLESMPDAAGSAAEVEREMRSEVVYAKQNVTITTNFAVRRIFFSFRVYRLDDLLWAYKQVIRQRVYFVPVGSTTALQMVFRGGGKIQVRVAATAVDGLIATIGSRHPFALYGYSAELLKLARSNAAIAAVVDQRRKSAAV